MRWLLIPREWRFTTCPSARCIILTHLHTYLASYNTFASGGSDGTVSLWDHTAKKRLRQFPKYPTGVTSIAFSTDGANMAVGCSFSWDVSEEKRSQYSQLGDKVAIFIREIGDEAKVCYSCFFLRCRWDLLTRAAAIQPKAKAA